MEKKGKIVAVAEIIDNGPLKITGQLNLRDVKKDFSKSLNEVYLCRCGRSGCKPYCDESHKK